jgi:hypothetical protein
MQNLIKGAIPDTSYVLGSGNRSLARMQEDN